MSAPAPTAHPNHPWVRVPRLLRPEDKQMIRQLARAAHQTLHDAGETLTHDDLAIIIVDPKHFTGVYVDAATLQDAFRRHRVFSNMYLLHQPPEPVESPVPEPATKKRARRNSGERLKGLIRDLRRCFITWTSHPHMAHIFPFAATGTNWNLQKTQECFIIIQMMFSIAKFNKWYPQKLGAFEFMWNLVALNQQLHGWLDKGFWAFRYKTNGQDNGKYYVEVVLVWLPLCDPKQGQTAVILDGGPNDSVNRIFDQLEDAYNNHFRPRRPEGAGFIGAFFSDAVQVVSGNIFRIPHDTQQDCLDCVDMVEFQWQAMLILTVRGVTGR